MTNEHICALAPFCKLAGSDKCNDQCAPFISVNSRYENADIPSDYKGVTLANSPAREEQSEIYTVLESYVETFSTDVRIKNLYLYSKSPGTGKTTTAIALLNEFIRRRFLYYAKEKRTIPEALGAFLDINDLQREYNLATMSKDQERLSRITDNIEYYRQVEFLVIDDIAIRSATESFRSLVHSIVNYRVVNNLPTVFTSNVSFMLLDTVFDSRLRDRIIDQTLELNFKGESHRGRR